ncbi:MAG: ParD-like family protein [Defluviitaleaceae bacterium]|nr:ParD-like family protein [Defluviitaleaceae bacterium]
MSAKEIKKVYFPVRIFPDLIEKLKHIAKYNNRSANGEIEHLIVSRIRDFEKIHGKIGIDNIET